MSVATAADLRAYRASEDRHHVHPGHPLGQHGRARRSRRPRSSAARATTTSWPRWTCARSRLGGYDDPRIPGSWDNLVATAMQVRSGKGLISHEIFAGATKAEVARAGARPRRSRAPRHLHRPRPRPAAAGRVAGGTQEPLHHDSFDTFLDRPCRARARKRRTQAFWRAHDPLMVLRRWSAVITARPHPRPDRAAIRRDDPRPVVAVRLGHRRRQRPTRSDRGPAQRLAVARRGRGAPPGQRAAAGGLPLAGVRAPGQRRFNHLANEQPRGDRIRDPGALPRRRAQGGRPGRRRVSPTPATTSSATSTTWRWSDEAFGPDDSVPAEQVNEAAVAAAGARAGQARDAGSATQLPRRLLSAGGARRARRTARPPPGCGGSSRRG